MSTWEPSADAGLCARPGFGRCDPGGHPRVRPDADRQDAETAGQRSLGTAEELQSRRTLLLRRRGPLPPPLCQPHPLHGTGFSCRAVPGTGQIQRAGTTHVGKDPISDIDTPFPLDCTGDTLRRFLPGPVSALVTRFLHLVIGRPPCSWSCTALRQHGGRALVPVDAHSL